MSDASTQPGPLERAYSLVGRFLYHFARVEQKINQAVIKLSDLDEKSAPIVALVDFARKADLVRQSAYAQASDTKDKQFANDTCNRVFKINNDRRMIAHLSFEPTSGGDVQFGTTVTKDGRVLAGPIWTDTKFSERYAEMSALEEELDKLILLIKPALAFGWFNQWAEVYHRSSSALMPVAATEVTQWPPNEV